MKGQALNTSFIVLLLIVCTSARLLSTFGRLEAAVPAKQGDTTEQGTVDPEDTVKDATQGSPEGDTENGEDAPGTPTQDDEADPDDPESLQKSVLDDACNYESLQPMDFAHFPVPREVIAQFAEEIKAAGGVSAILKGVDVDTVCSEGNTAVATGNDQGGDSVFLQLRVETARGRITAPSNTGDKTVTGGTEATDDPTKGVDTEGDLTKGAETTEVDAVDPPEEGVEGDTGNPEPEEEEKGDPELAKLSETYPVMVDYGPGQDNSWLAYETQVFCQNAEASGDANSINYDEAMGRGGFRFAQVSGQSKQTVTQFLIWNELAALKWLESKQGQLDPDFNKFTQLTNCQGAFKQYARDQKEISYIAFMGFRGRLISQLAEAFQLSTQPPEEDATKGQELAEEGEGDSKATKETGATTGESAPQRKASESETGGETETVDPQ